MKVIHITTMDFGGAGLAVLRIHETLLKMGIDSKVLVLTKINNTQNVISFLPRTKNRYVRGLFKLMERSKRNLWESLNPIVKEMKTENISDDCFFTLPISPYLVEKHPLVRNADIIHLHWIQNFINYPSFFSKVKKPCVWTFHDENIGLGGFHYLRDRDRYYEKYKRFEDYALRIKHESFQKKQNVRLVPLSRMMSAFVENVPHCRHWDRTIIHNPVNTEIFQLHKKDECRGNLNLPSDKTIILFVAYDINDVRKGLDRLVSALKILDRDDIVLCCVGGYDMPPINEMPNILLGSINDERHLSKVYSAADLFVLASDQEAFAQTPLEAIASGTPVVATPCSGTEELINAQNGIRCNDFSVEELSRCIKLALEKTYEPFLMRKDIIKRFSPEHIASQYVDIYKQMLTQ